MIRYLQILLGCVGSIPCLPDIGIEWNVILDYRRTSMREIRMGRFEIIIEFEYLDKDWILDGQGDFASSWHWNRVGFISIKLLGVIYFHFHSIETCLRPLFGAGW